MNVEHASTAKTESRKRHSSARLQGRWLVLARALWITLVALTLAIFVASLPVYVALLHTLCTRAACQYQQLTHSQAESLTGIGLSLDAYAASTVALTLASVVVCLVVSTVIVWRRSDDRMALIVALMLVTLGPFSVPISVSDIPFPWQVPNKCLLFLALALLVLVFLLFPSGQFVPRWMRWTLVVFLAMLVPFTFFPIAPLIPKTPASEPGWLVFLGELATVVVVQLYRYRHVSSPLERQQTKWVFFGLAAPITVWVLATVLALLFPMLAETVPLYPLAFNELSYLLPLFLPLSFGFAMLGSLLWEIDVLINRTLVYGALTLSLTGVYVGLVIGLSALLRGLIRQDNSVAIIISTLVIYALIGPLRIRIQRLIDRRFYRRKYNATKTVAAFSATLRQEVDLGQLREHLLAVVQETMQPAHVSLWLRPPEHGGKQRTPWRATPPVPSEGR